MSRPVSLLEAAIFYANLGWHVFPLHTPTLDPTQPCSCGNAACKSIGKHPRQKGWQQSATTEEAVLRRWWGQWPDANIGLACGPDSGLWVLDVDLRHDGLTSLQALWDEHDDWPHTVKAVTGSGSFHYFFADGEGVHNAVGFRPGLDTRAAGGLVVLAPSLHESGRRYEWTPKAKPKTTPLADAPDWLLDLVRAPAKKQALVAAGVSETVSEGSRNDRLFRDAAAMRRRGMDEEIIYAALQVANEKFCSPPLDLSELQDISRKACRYAPEPYLNGSAPANGAAPAADSGVAPLRRRLVPVSIVMRRPAPEWIVPDLIQQHAHTVIFGPPNVGKTFVALSLCWSVANGFTWFGRKVRRGPVVYIAAEGGYGLTTRVNALQSAQPAGPEPPIYVVEEPPAFISPGDIAEFVLEMRELPEAPAIVAIDTLALSLAGGDENSGKDMGLYNAGIHQIRRSTGASIVTVHHTNALGDRERGHSSLRGNAETMIEASAAAGYIALHCEKQRDARSFETMTFSLLPVGDSCVLAVAGPANGALKDEEVVILRALAFAGEPLRAGALRSASGLGETLFYRVLNRLQAVRLLASQGVARSAQRFYHLTANGKMALAASTGETGAERFAPEPERERWS